MEGSGRTQAALWVELMGELLPTPNCAPPTPMQYFWFLERGFLERWTAGWSRGHAILGMSWWAALQAQFCCPVPQLRSAHPTSENILCEEQNWVF